MAKVSKIASAVAELGSPLSAVRINAQAALTTAVANAQPSHVKAGKAAGKAKVSKIPEVARVQIATTAMEAKIAACLVDMEGISYQLETKQAQLESYLRANFKANPTLEQREHLHAIVEQAALVKGFTGQMMAKHLNAAIKAIWGELAKSTNPASVARQAKRKAEAEAAKAAKVDSSNDPLAAGNSTGGHVQTMGLASVESWITEHGILMVMAACEKILRAEKITAAVADAQAKACDEMGKASIAMAEAAAKAKAAKAKAVKTA